MISTKPDAEFDGLRAVLYAQALEEYPHARDEDVKAMHRLLKPQKGESILGFGEGNGFFVPHIANAIGTEGEYLVTDPSQDQLNAVIDKYDFPNMKTQVIGAEGLSPNKLFEKVWSFGAFHHCPNQEKALKNIYNALEENGTAVICDVWQGSKLAEHFDGPVAEYCCTGHDVNFLSETYAKTISRKAGFQDYQIVELPQKWKFDSEYDLGRFIYKLHAMTELPGTEVEQMYQVQKGCKIILGVEKVDDKYELNWPMKALIAQK